MGMGSRTVGEPGVAGVTVRLLDGSGNPTGMSTTTDGSGYYSFTVAPGTYRLEFAAPSGMAWTSADRSSDDALDSDVDPATGRTGAFTVVAGQTDTSWDAGLVAAGTIVQWATTVLGCSSEYAASPGAWSSSRALGTPDVTVYRDDPNAWAPSVANGSTEWIALAYTNPVYATAVRVRESYGNGAVTKIELRDHATGTWQSVWSGVDPTAAGAVADLEVALSRTSYLVDGVRVTLDMNHSSAWEELDAVALEGVVPEIASQWASTVLGCSSEYAASPAPWSSARALGAPDVTTYRDDPNAWAPSVANGTTEWLALGYATPVYATGVRVRESFGNGAVTKIELRDHATGTWQSVWSGVDPTAAGAVADLAVVLSPTSYLVDGMRVTLDMNHSSAWEELDAVALEGVVPTTVSQWANTVLGYSSQYAASPAPWSSARALGAPDVLTYRDDPNAWARACPMARRNGWHWVCDAGICHGSAGAGELGNRAVAKIELRDHATGTWQQVWSGVDATAPRGGGGPGGGAESDELPGR